MTCIRNDHSVKGSSWDRTLIITTPAGLPPPEHLAAEMRSLQTNSCGDGSFRFFQGSSPPLSVHPISESRGTQFRNKGYFECYTCDWARLKRSLLWLNLAWNCLCQLWETVGIFGTIKIPDKHSRPHAAVGQIWRNVKDLPRTWGRVTCRPSCTSHMGWCPLLWHPGLSGSGGSLQAGEGEEMFVEAPSAYWRSHFMPIFRLLFLYPDLSGAAWRMWLWKQFGKKNLDTQWEGKVYFVLCLQPPAKYCLIFQLKLKFFFNLWQDLKRAEPTPGQADVYLGHGLYEAP